MQSTLKPKQTDDPHDFVVVAPDAVRVAPADEEISNLLQEAARRSLKPQTGTESDLPAGPAVPPVDTTFRPTAVNDVQIPGLRPSIGRRAVRAFTALLLAACIGAAAIAWQSSGNVTKKIIAKWAPQFALTWLLEKPDLSAQPNPSDVPADAANAAPPQPAALAQTAPQGIAPAAAAPSAESAQLLQSMARDLASVGQEVEQLKASIEELKANQQQMSRDAARTSEQNRASEQNKASEQNLRPRISAPPPRPAVARARKPVPPYYPPPQAAVAPPLPQTVAPYAPRQSDYAPRPPDPQPQSTVQPPADPELASVPRPPMPVVRQ
jgi:hypothetical protein